MSMWIQKWHSSMGFGIFSVFLYAITFVGHVLLGLPALSSWIAITIYFVVGLLFLVTFYIWKGMPLSLWIFYSFFPLLLTLAIGLFTAVQLYPTGPDKSAPSVSIESADPNPLLMHISDTHFIGMAREKTFQGANWNLAAIARLEQLILRLRPDYLLITGDVTDTGEKAEWDQAFKTLLGTAKEACIPVIMAPGTHDLQPAFFRGGGRGSVERADAELSRRFLEAQREFGPDLQTVDRRTVRALLSWEPTNEEIQETAREQYLACNRAALGFDTRPSRSWAKRCADATRPSMVADNIIKFHTARACREWFPLLHHDAAERTTVIVLCSSGVATARLGRVALGSFGQEQLKRLEEALEQLPNQSRYVLVMLHHPPVRRWGDLWGLPKTWWRWSAWEESPLFNYAFLLSEWRESRDLIEKLLIAAKKRTNTVFILLYGHLHESHLSTIYEDQGVILWASEAPALYEGATGVRVGYATGDSGEIKWKWLRF